MREHELAVLVQALPYIRRFHDALFVVKLGGGLLKDPEHLEAIAADLTLLHMVGVRLIVVHGGGPQANALSQDLGFEPEMVAGRRVTDERALEVAKMVFAGKLNTEMLSALQKHGARAVGISGVDGGLVRARRRPITEVVEDGKSRKIDFGFVGDVEEVDPSLVNHLVEKRFIPVMSSLAADREGSILNVNADTIAAELAVATGAHKLISMTGARGVYRKGSEDVYSVLTIEDTAGLMADGTASAGMRPKLMACCRAVSGGVAKAHIIDGRARHSLLEEVFTDEGAGTMIVSSKDQLSGEAGGR